MSAQETAELGTHTTTPKHPRAPLSSRWHRYSQGELTQLTWNKMRSRPTGSIQCAPHGRKQQHLHPPEPRPPSTRRPQRDRLLGLPRSRSPLPTPALPNKGNVLGKRAFPRMLPWKRHPPRRRSQQGHHYCHHCKCSALVRFSTGKATGGGGGG